jgi:hypothetical protein
MNDRFRRRLIALFFSCAVIAGITAAQEPRTNPVAKVQQDFQSRVDAYMAIHKKHEKDAPPLKETGDPEKIKASQDILATKIRAARKGAKQGDIFTPEIARLLQQLMNPELKGKDGAETKQAMKEDAPPATRLQVNSRYPEGAPLSTVPPNILAALPKLPEDLEYRVVGRDLILRDVHANLIVDFIPNAIR